jgi:hypothetical protein
VTHPNKPRAFRHAPFSGKIGIARADIAPPVGIYTRKWHAAKYDIARTIHRPLTLTAMSLRSLGDGKPLVLVDVSPPRWNSLPNVRVKMAIPRFRGLGARVLMGGIDARRLALKKLAQIPET